MLQFNDRYLSSYYCKTYPWGNWLWRWNYFSYHVLLPSGCLQPCNPFFVTCICIPFFHYFIIKKIFQKICHSICTIYIMWLQYLYSNSVFYRRISIMKTFLKDQCEFLSTASFTIEAAVIFPLILFILFSLLHLTFTLHDAAVAKAVSYRSLISQSTQKQPLYHSAGNSSDYFFILNTSSFSSFYSEKGDSYATSPLYRVPVYFSKDHPCSSLWQYKALNRK